MPELCRRREGRRQLRLHLHRCLIHECIPPQDAGQTRSEALGSCAPPCAGTGRGRAALGHRAWLPASVTGPQPAVSLSQAGK